MDINNRRLNRINRDIQKLDLDPTSGFSLQAEDENLEMLRGTIPGECLNKKYIFNKFL
jgi:hypothetical protein